MPAEPRNIAVEELPTVVLEHARTGQPVVVDLRDYLAGRNGRFADWRLLGQGGFIDPPRLQSDGGPSDPEPPEPESADPEPSDAEPARPPSPEVARRRRRKSRRSRP